MGMKLLRLLGAAIGLLPCAAAAEDPVMLNGKQLQDLFFGNTLVGHTEWADADWNAYVDLDGRMHIKGARPSGPYEFFGQVTIEDDRWCEQWQIKNHNDKKCRQVSRLGDRFDILRDDGKAISSFTVRAGDPNGLRAGLLAGVTAQPVAAQDSANGDQPAVTETTAPAAPAAADTAPAAPPSGAAASAPTEIATTPPPAAPTTAVPAANQPISLGLPQQNSAIALTNESVIGWHRQGVDDATIVSLIKQSATKFDLSPAGLEALGKAGITKTVIGAMLAADLGQ